MKKTNKHPLTFFREEGEKRKAMFQKGGYKTPVQNLKKAQDGVTVGPFEEGTQKYLDAKYPGTAMKFTGPVDPEYMADQRDRVASPTRTGWARKSDLERSDRMAEESQMRSPGWADDFNTGMGLSEDNAYKRGGRVKKPLMKKGGAVKSKKKK
jgi:hypothetical protein